MSPKVIYIFITLFTFKAFAYFNLTYGGIRINTFNYIFLGYILIDSSTNFSTHFLGCQTIHTLYPYCISISQTAYRHAALEPKESFQIIHYTCKLNEYQFKTPQTRNTCRSKDAQKQLEPKNHASDVCPQRLKEIGLCEILTSFLFFKKHIPKRIFICLNPLGSTLIRRDEREVNQFKQGTNVKEFAYKFDGFKFAISKMVSRTNG